MAAGDAAAGGDDPRRVAINAELQRLEESATYSAQSQFEQAKSWRAVNFLLGVPTSVLAAVSGALVLAEDRYDLVAAALALLAAAGTAILTTLNASHRMNQAAAAGNAYLEIQTAARQARLVDVPHLTPDAARTTLGELTARRDEQNRQAEPPSRRSYRRGGRNIGAGGQAYAVDAEAEGDRA